MWVVNFLAHRRYNIVETVGIATAAGTLFGEHWMFGWTTLLVTLGISVGLQLAASEPS